jgi:Fe2+ transport system protein B
LPGYSAPHRGLFPLQPDQKTWQHFKEEMRRVYEFNRKQTISYLEVLLRKQTTLLNRQNDTKEGLMALERVAENNALRERLRIDYDNDEKELQTLALEIAQMKERNKLKLKILEQDEFIELMQKMPKILRSFTDMKGLVTVLRKIFLKMEKR